MTKVRTLKGDVKYVFDELKGGDVVTIEQLHARIVAPKAGRDLSYIPKASIGARLRDLRKPAFGSHNIVKIGTGRNVSYQLQAPAAQAA